MVKKTFSTNELTGCALFALLSVGFIWIPLFSFIITLWHAKSFFFLSLKKISLFIYEDRLHLIQSNNKHITSLSQEEGEGNINHKAPILISFRDTNIFKEVIKEIHRCCFFFLKHKKYKKLYFHLVTLTSQLAFLKKVYC